MRVIATLVVAAGLTAGLVTAGPAQAAEPTNPYHPFPTAEAFVNQTYKNFFRREPTARERLNAIDRLEDGETMAEYVVWLSETPESNADIRSVIRLYRTYYLRNPDFRGYYYWLEQRQKGMALQDISTQFSIAGEFAIRYGVLTDEKFIDLVYQNVLDRLPDGKGRAYWLTMLKGGLYRGTLMTLFSETPEYVNKSFGVVTTAQLYTSLLQRSINTGLSDTYGPRVQSGKMTPVELAGRFMKDDKYLRRFKNLAG